MALVLKDGTWQLVNNGNPDARQWREVYRVNFKTVPNHNFKTEGDTLVISGSAGNTATWSVVNKGNASTLLINSGLKIDPSNGSNLFSGGDTAPRIMCELNDLVDGWDPTSQTVACILRMTSSTGIQANYDSFGMVMAQNTGSLSSQNDRFCKSGPLFVTEENYDVSDGTEYDVEYTGVDADCVIMTIYPGGSVRTRGGTFNWTTEPSNKFPIPKPDNDWDTIHSTAIWNNSSTRHTDNPGPVDTHLIMTPEKWAVGPFCFEVSSGTGIEAVFTEFIVLRLE